MPERAGLVTGRPPGDDGVQVAIDSFMLARREPPAAR